MNIDASQITSGIINKHRLPPLNGDGGGTAADEVWIGPGPPSDPNIELWYDPEAEATTPAGSYIHTQAIPAAMWTINHELGFHPSVTVVDSTGDECFGDVNYPDVSTVVLTFSAEFSGVAYLS